MIGTAMSAIHTGLTAEIVRVEADVSSGFPRFGIVGLPDSAVRESKLRIRSAIRNCHLQFPQGRITVNLTPANFRKRGSGLDLAIAIAILRASGQLPPDDGRLAFLGELQLEGRLAAIESAVALALRLAKERPAGLFLSVDQQVPNELRSTLPLYRKIRLSDVVSSIVAGDLSDDGSVSLCPSSQSSEESLALDDIVGRAAEKRILTICAAGKHSLLLLGPPGIGKTLLATNSVHLLPNLSREAALESFARIEGKCSDVTLSRRPPLRAPHHSLTAAGMIGGGLPPKPGEATLAHKGVLLLDELLEFNRAALDALREPMGSKVINLSRSGRTATLPADFLLVATANPCPCGFFGYGDCRCLNSEIRKYWSRCSGPLLDRIEIVSYLDRETYTSDKFASPTGLQMRQQVESATAILNATQHSGKSLKNWFTKDAVVLLARLRDQVLTTDRAIHQVQRIAQTIAALSGRDVGIREDIEEATILRNSQRVPRH